MLTFKESLLKCAELNSAQFLRFHTMPSATGGKAISSGLGGPDDIGHLAALFFGP
jgi:hypothetical protein